MKENISRIRDCYGCGVCSAICPRNIISIELNKDGFYEPHIKGTEKCTHCGLCLDTCAFSHTELSLKESSLKSWAAWSNDDEIRRKCSSGGIGFEIGKQLIARGYKVVGCRYNIETERAEHYFANTTEELIQSIGSKYIQSHTAEAFQRINKMQKHLVVGTPCQIDSFRRMIKKLHCEDNFILMDFFCHCVPSMWAWRAYLKTLEPTIGKVTYASWRNKFKYGWHDSWIMGIDGDKTSEPIDWHSSYDQLIKEKNTFIQSRMSQGDMFYKLFLGDIALGPQCQKQCKYKYDKSSADIRIGDLWGTTYEKDQKGVSAVVAFTQTGQEVIESLTQVTLIEHPFDVIAEGQMKKNAKAREIAPAVMFCLRHGVNVDGVIFKLLDFCQRVITKLKLISK